MSNQPTADQRRKRGSSQEPRPSSKQRRPEAEAGPSYYEIDTSDSEPEVEHADNDRRVFGSIQEMARHYARVMIKKCRPGNALDALQHCMCLAQYIPGIPRDVRVALGGSWNIVSTEVRVDNAIIGHMWHRGLKNAVAENLDRNAENVENQELFIHVGEAPLPQVSRPALTSWVIQGWLHPGTGGKPFVLSAFCGEGKPPLEEFLGQVCDDAQRLDDTPLVLEGGRTLVIKPRAILADAAARSYIMGTVPQTSEYGCLKCELRGGGSFMGIGVARTHGHGRRSTDHLFHAGAIQELYAVFVAGSENGTVQPMTGFNAELMRTAFSTVELPHERRAAGRTFDSDMVNWTPAMWGYLMDVVGIVVFERVVQPELYGMYCNLHWAMAIYNNSRFNGHRETAQDLLQRYITKHNESFGAVSCHIAEHVRDGLEQFGPLPLISTNKCDDELSVLKEIVDVTKDGTPVQQLGTALLLRERASKRNFPYRTKKGAKIRGNFMLASSASDSWFLAADGKVVKFLTVKSSDPFVVYGKPLGQQASYREDGFADPIGLNAWRTTDKEALQKQHEYRPKDMICKLGIVNMPTFTSFVPLPESFE